MFVCVLLVDDSDCSYGLAICMTSDECCWFPLLIFLSIRGPGSECWPSILWNLHDFTGNGWHLPHCAQTGPDPQRLSGYVWFHTFLDLLCVLLNHGGSVVHLCGVLICRCSHSILCVFRINSGLIFNAWLKLECRTGSSLTHPITFTTSKLALRLASYMTSLSCAVDAKSTMYQFFRHSDSVVWAYCFRECRVFKSCGAHGFLWDSLDPVYKNAWGEKFTCMHSDAEYEQFPIPFTTWQPVSRSVMLWSYRDGMSALSSLSLESACNHRA